MSNEQELLRLINVAIEAAKHVAAEATESWLSEDAANAQLVFEKLAEALKAGKLASPNGAGFGITKALGEWAPEPLFAAGAAVEEFYMENF